MNYYNSNNEAVQSMVYLIDFLVLNICMLVFCYAMPGIVPNYIYNATKISVLAANFAMAISQYFFSTIVLVGAVSFYNMMGRIFQLVFSQGVIMLLFLSILSHENFLRYCIFLSITFYFSLTIVRYCELLVIRYFRKQERNIRNILFVGHDPAIVNLYKDMISDFSTGYRFLGYYSDREINNCPEKLCHLGSIDDLNSKMESFPGSHSSKIDNIFVCLSHDESDEIIKIMRFCDKNVIHFYYLQRMFGNYMLHLKAEQFGSNQLFVNYKGPLSHWTNSFVKRTFDILVSGIICLCMIPLIPIIGIIIKLQSPGPVFFAQKRTGINGKTFLCYKFRSMHINKHADMIQATEHDVRKFAFGSFMRKTNLDEFPQFFNVLLGDMSIVGPRPHMLLHTSEYSRLIDKYMVRHFCKPGITGWAQVTGFRGETKELWQMEERVRRDIWYLENWTIFLDFKIMLLTAKTIFIPDKNAY
ncbi:exopolysaccharide biosynthesis polyprenyl glycosylphosphotransferase [Prevotella sp. A2931]|uniref:Exopolysaccharide biosynthesis polyprenyl glycosylphosphotransferase n=1 Tax=Prevotella illustrans TaxID=2800387 RepID=A0ABS3M564_9BACT|nr:MULTISPECIES: exopolysaccharide biosynthesis polyprenyl glycosylphosphotransferase [Prevotella]MBO1363312.1 exopolysaccharide biosynthesis polyprenyl glycosylphosphotransferase [Prevotella illustrans]PTL25820.1 undecaprenyl-phosphate glucose phosphotransferase [Prevotella sp. oral taxon 820]